MHKADRHADDDRILQIRVVFQRLQNVGALPQTSSFEPGMASARSIETRARVVSRAFASRAISSSAMKQTA